MTDRELLELAAKAAGIKIDKSEFNGGGRGNTGFNISGDVVVSWHDNETWNPLLDDGDALRLAVKLGLCITQYPIYAEPKHSVLVKRPQLRDDDRDRIEEVAVYDSDPYAATRRAIVRAAAAIGEGMK